MDVTINQSRAEKIALDIDDLFSSIISKTYDHSSEDGHILSLDLTRKDVYYSSILDEEISCSLA